MAGKGFIQEQRNNMSKQKKTKDVGKKSISKAPAKSIAKMNKSTGRNR